MTYLAKTSESIFKVLLAEKSDTTDDENEDFIVDSKLYEDDEVKCANNSWISKWNQIVRLKDKELK